MTPFKLTPDGVREAARQAYRERRLTAQHGGGCIYVQKIGEHDCGCAVGVALPPQVREALSKNDTRNSSRVSLLLADKVVEIAPYELEEITTVQMLHDDWVKMRRHNPQHWDYGENRFRLAVGLPPLEAVA